MAVVMEVVVILIYLVTGWKTNRVDAAQRGPIMSRSRKGNLDGGISRPGWGQGRRQGSTHGLISAAVAAAQQQPAEQNVEGGRSGMR